MTKKLISETKKTKRKLKNDDSNKDDKINLQEQHEEDDEENSEDVCDNSDNSETIGIDEESENDDGQRQRDRIKPRPPIHERKSQYSSEILKQKNESRLTSKIENKSPKKCKHKCLTFFSSVSLIIISVLSGYFISSNLDESHFKVSTNFVTLLNQWRNGNNWKDKQIMEFKKNVQPLITDVGMKTLDSIFRKFNGTQYNDALILLIIINPDQEVIATEIAKNLSQLIGILNSGEEDSYQQIQLNESYQSSEIERIYHQTFKDEGKSVLLLEHLEMANPSIATVFYQFNDHNQSKIRPMFTIVTLKTSDHNIKSNLGMLDVEKISQKILEKLWSSALNIDQLEPLINRFAEYTIFLKT